jgi:hypothetical protein
VPLYQATVPVQHRTYTKIHGTPAAAKLFQDATHVDKIRTLKPNKFEPFMRIIGQGLKKKQNIGSNLIRCLKTSRTVLLPLSIDAVLPQNG